MKKTVLILTFITAIILLDCTIKNGDDVYNFVGEPILIYKMNDASYMVSKYPEVQIGQYRFASDTEEGHQMFLKNTAYLYEQKWITKSDLICEIANEIHENPKVIERNFDSCKPHGAVWYVYKFKMDDFGGYRPSAICWSW